MLHHPVRFLVQVILKSVYRKVYCFSAVGMGTKLLIVVQDVLLLCGIPVVFRMPQQMRQFFRNGHFLHIQSLLHLAEDRCDFPQISGIGAGKGHAFAFVCSHVQCIVPVCVVQTQLIVCAHIVECAEILQ